MTTHWSERKPHKYISKQNMNTKQSELDGNISHSGVPGGVVFKPPLPPKFRRPFKIVPNLTRL